MARTAQPPRNGDPTDQDEFAAAPDPDGELIDLCLKPHNLVAMVAVVHGASLWCPAYTPSISTVTEPTNDQPTRCLQLRAASPFN